MEKITSNVGDIITFKQNISYRIIKIEGETIEFELIPKTTNEKDRNNAMEIAFDKLVANPDYRI